MKRLKPILLRQRDRRREAQKNTHRKKEQDTRERRPDLLEGAKPAAAETAVAQRAVRRNPLKSS